MRLVDRAVIVVARRRRGRHRERELAAAGVSVERRGTSPALRVGVRATVAAVAVAGILAGAGAYGDHRAEVAAESEREHYEAQLSGYEQAVHTRDVCSAEVGADSPLAAGVMRLTGDPEIRACDAAAEARAAEIRADTDTEVRR